MEQTRDRDIVPLKEHCTWLGQRLMYWGTAYMDKQKYKPMIILLAA